MNRDQAINYLKSSGMSDEQVNAVVEALSNSENPNKSDDPYQTDMDDAWEQAKREQADDDVISRQDAIKAIDEKAKRIKNEDTLNGLAGAVGILFDLPSVKPQEKIGYWIKYGKLYQCSECKELSCCQGKFCNECGAKMVEPQESEIKHGTYTD